MQYKGKVYAKVGGRYLECSETIEDFEKNIEFLKNKVEKLNLANVSTCKFSFIDMFSAYTQGWRKRGNYAGIKDSSSTEQDCKKEFDNWHENIYGC